MSRTTSCRVRFDKRVMSAFQYAASRHYIFRVTLSAADPLQLFNFVLLWTMKMRYWYTRLNSKSQDNEHALSIIVSLPHIPAWPAQTLLVLNLTLTFIIQPNTPAVLFQERSKRYKKTGSGTRKSTCSLLSLYPSTPLYTMLSRTKMMGYGVRGI